MDLLLLVLMGVIIPIGFGILHTIASVYLIYTRGNTIALGWNMTHIVEAFYVNHHMNENASEFIKNIQI